MHSAPQEGDEISRDWTTLFDDNLFKFDTSLIPEALALYERLHVKKAPLTLIPPQVSWLEKHRGSCSFWVAKRANRM